MYKDNFNKTKIVATIGPATSSTENLEKIIRAGVDVCRLNFSHGEHSVHLEVAERIREINQRLGSHIAILQDLQGPKLRIGKVDGEMMLKDGDPIHITTVECVSSAEKLFVSYERLAQDAKPGEKILLNDGKVELVIEKILDDKNLMGRVVAGGPLTSNKGFNLPQTKVTVP
jgi:pyruvate kinase